jgi:isocitrate/isopropylmalate dehydrogenase
LGLNQSAVAIRRAVATVLKAGQPRTPDLGGSSSTAAVAEAVLAAI